MSVDPPGLCEHCGSYLRHGQRYCLGCGARIGSRSPHLLALLRRRRLSNPVAQIAPAATDAPALRGPGLTLPSPRVSTLLVLMFLGFGVIVGGAARSRAADTLAASTHRPVKVILPPASAPGSTPAPSAESPSSATATEPPAAEPEPTPAATSGSAGASAKSPSTASTPAAPSAKTGAGGSAGSPSAGSSKLPAVKHVFVIMLSNQPFVSVFGPSSGAPYLSQSLEKRGELLVRYYAVAHEQLANGIAFLSGQGPTTATAANCPTYADIAPTGVGADQQVSGQGCIYPSSTETLAGQLSAKRLSWRSYVEGIDEGAPSSGPCAHPAVGAADPTAGAPSGQSTPAQRYATFRDPFVYFHSVIDSRACAADIVGLNALSLDLSKGTRAPSLSYIVPDRCHDANPTPCAPGAPAGPLAADGFLKVLVPKILASKAYKDGGLLVITTDEAPSAGEFVDSSSCCGQPKFPNLPAPAGTTAGLAANGGGQVGALLLSPFVKGGTTSQEPYNHFSLLRTIEDLFGLKHLGYAALSHVSSFEPAIFSAHPSG
jgi:phosphatidylinositol-3-phosphatase